MDQGAHGRDPTTVASNATRYLEADEDVLPHDRDATFSPEHADLGIDPADDPWVVGGEVPEGTTLGRYRVQSVLGRGGMGVVLRAHDPMLDRPVALKQLRLRPVRTTAVLRLRREAQAMARVSHPNVVEVYDVLQEPRGVVIAMELVDGWDLRQWLELEPRSPRSVAERLDVMRQAGRGLAAVHAAGLVHRDFKPSNVLVGRDGRARVVDFGIARLDAELAPADTGREPRAMRTLVDAPISPLSGGALTEEGMAVGTPAYMAPEQHLGQAADAASDQYAFCVSLWEVLVGERPFQGTLAEVIGQKLEGPPRWPERPDVPAWIGEAIVRGLRARPSDRFLGMRALLDALARDPGRRRRRALWGLGLGTTLASVLAVARAGDVDQGCGDPRARLEGVWDRARRMQVDDALRATRRGYAETTAAAVLERLDARAEAFVVAHEQACAATREQGPLGAAELDRRTACLERRRAELLAVVDELASADDAVLEAALPLVDELPPLSWCADPERLERQAEPPVDPEARRQADVLRRRLDEVRAHDRVGRHTEAEGMLAELVAPIEALGHEPLVAELRLVQGEVAQGRGHYDVAAPLLADAYARALAVRYDDVAFEAALSLGALEGASRRHHEEAERWLGTALALARARHDGGVDEGRVRTTLGATFVSAGRLPEAEGELRRALELLEGGEGEHELALAQALDHLGVALSELGRDDDAVPLVERALEIKRRRLGPDHPALAVSWTNLGSVALRAERFDDAATMLHNARDLLAAAHGERHPQLAALDNNLGVLHYQQGRYVEAEQSYRRALALREATLGPEHPSVADLLLNLGSLAQEQGRYADALPLLQRARAVYEATLPAEHPDLVLVEGNIGLVLHRMGRLPEAEERLRSGLALAERVHGPSHAAVGDACAYLGSLLLDRGALPEAEVLQRRALEIRTALYGPDHGDVAISTSNLGWVWGEQGRLDDAIGQQVRAVEILEREGGSHPALPVTLVRLGMLERRAGRSDDAVISLRRAVERMPADAYPTEERARVRLELARALWADPRAHAEAQALAREVLELLSDPAGGASGPAATVEAGVLRAAAQAWLRSHGG